MPNQSATAPSRSFLGIQSILAIFGVVVIAFLFANGGSPSRVRAAAIALAHRTLTLKARVTPDSRGLPADCRALESLMRLRSRPQTVGSDSEEVALSRNGLDTMDALFPPLSCSVTETSAAGVKVYWLVPKRVKKDSSKVIVYLHGGAYVGGSIKSHGALACEFATAANTRAFFVEYTRAPDKLHPGGVQEAITAVNWLASEGGIDMSNVVIAGDSAGGGMTLLVTQHLIQAQSSLPAAVVVLSPWADLTCTAKSLTTKAPTDLVLNPARTKNWVRMILGGLVETAGSPQHSPLFGSFDGFPPLYVSVGTAEGLYDDAVAVATKAKAGGVEVVLSERKDMQHVVPFFRHFCSVADDEFTKVAEFIQTALRN